MTVTAWVLARVGRRVGALLGEGQRVERVREKRVEMAWVWGFGSVEGAVVVSCVGAVSGEDVG